MKNLFLLAIAALALSAFQARAEEPEPDDRVALELAAEDWVTTKTAHVTVSVEAAVTAATAGGARADMTKSVDDVAKADWRLTGFNRNEDQAGMERWSATFEARVPEGELGGINDAAKKQSKAGMQVSVTSVDFTPTLEETEAARAALRVQIYKMANEQLTALNAALPGRDYRIADIDFTGSASMPEPRLLRAQPMMMTAVASNASSSDASSMERSEKVTLQARVVYAALPETKAAK